MPPLPSVPGAIKIVMKGLKSGKNWANVLHYLYTGGPPTLADVISIATFMASSWSSQMAARATADAELTGVEVIDLSSVFGAKVDHTFTPIVGTNAEDPLPNNVSFLVDYPVTMLYRGGHPRTYILPGGDGDLDSVGLSWITWNPAFIAAMATSWTNFTNNLPGTTVGTTTIGDQCAIRYKSGGVPLVTPIKLALPTFNTEANVASQRRRSRLFS